MKRQFVTAFFIAIATVFFLSTPTLRGQEATTSLNGVVTDTSGAVLPGASVTATRAATGEVHQTTANAHGEYQFQQLIPGTWTVKVSAPGFGDQSKVSDLLVSLPATIDFKMGLGAITQTVNVSAQTETLNATDATLGNAITDRTIEELPMIDRNVPDLLSLQPGVLYLGHEVDAVRDSRTGAVNGVRSDQGNITMDGLDDNDVAQGLAFTGILRETLDSIDEFRVTTELANSNQGYAAGAQVNLVTKSGSNQFHGSAYEYNRNTATAANDWFNKNAELSSGLPNLPGKYIRNTYGAAVGGPIKKNRLFFFANYESSHIRENAQVEEEVPTASLQAGNLIYQSNGVNVTQTPAQIAATDPNCHGSGTCPWGPGVDPNMLKLLSEYPVANGSALGDGLNLGSYSFSSRYPINLNTSIVRLDWEPVSRNHLFFRGNLQDDTTAGPPPFPGQPPSYKMQDNSKGLGVGDTWEIRSNLINDFRYGYVRRGNTNSGWGCGGYVTFFRTLSTPTAENCTSTSEVPVYNFIDNVSWAHGKHTLSFGGDLRIITNYNAANSNSYNNADGNIDWLNNGGAIAGSGGSLDPGGFGQPPVDPADAGTYSTEVAMMAGLVPYVLNKFNFKVQPGGQTGVTEPEGTPIVLNYHSKEFEYYVQDQWKLKRNVTLTVGLRHVLLQPPYETHGQQVQPTVNTHQWFDNRVAGMHQGITDQPDLAFGPAGKANGKPSYWSMQYGNIAPRIALAIAPNDKTTVRLGAGMYYDHFGEGIVSELVNAGSFGLSTSITNPPGQYSVDNSPRLTSITALPPLQGVTIPSVIPYPFIPPNNVNTGLGVAAGVDNQLKTPYTIATNLSIQHQLPHGFSFEANYVGTFGRHLLNQRDIATPLDLTDPKSGTDYFAAAKLLGQAYSAGQTTVQAIPYWEDMFPYLKTSTMSATQNIYTNVYAPQIAQGNYAHALMTLDAYCQPSQGGLGCGPYIDPNGNVTTRFFQRQFSSLYSWSSIGTSSYNALQLTARKVTKAGLSFDFSYALSKAIDLGSDAERAGLFSTISFSVIANAFNPKTNRAVSDYDTRHLLTGHFTYQLPFGQGMRYSAQSNRAVNALIGGWTLSGIFRVSSGLPFGIGTEFGYATDTEAGTPVVVTGPVAVHKHLDWDVGGLPEVFANPNALQNGITTGFPIRYAYPGEGGARAPFRGDGYFEPDGSLSKSWKTFHEQTLRFGWEVFNVTNSSRFDTNPLIFPGFGSLNETVGSGAGFGIYSSPLVQSRRQQFSLRYDF
jgi:hypothetical protein